MFGTSVGSVMLRAAALGVAGALASLAGRHELPGPIETLGFVAGGYGLSLLLFAAFARLRRDDLIMAVGAFLLTLSLLRYLDGTLHATTPILFGLAGAGAAWLPSRVERFRREERRAGRWSVTRTLLPALRASATADASGFRGRGCVQDPDQASV